MQRPTLLTLLVLMASHAARADTVTLSAGEGERGTIQVTGEVLDYTGRQIAIQSTSGTPRKLPAERVIEVETTWPEGYTRGRAELTKRNYPQAAELLATAARGDQRAWVRRLVMEQLMQCYASAGDAATAGRLFVELAKSDPATPAYAHAPLAWHAGSQLPPSTVAEWLASDTPAAELLGASHALAGRERAASLELLRKLTRLGDDRIAPLAQMQLWRAEVVTAKPADVDRWERRLREWPEPVTAGGWVVVGDTRRQLRQFDASALAYLRASMLAPHDPQLAAYALWQASRVSDAGGQQDEAAELARQTVRDYPKTAAAQQARSMLQSAE